MPMFIMGGLALAQGVFGGIMGSSNAKAQAMQAELQQRQANFQNQLKVDTENRNLLRQYRAQVQQNIQIEKMAVKERAFAELGTKQQFNNARSNMSKQVQQTNDMFLAAASSRNISTNSASVKALLRQNSQLAEDNMKMMRVNYGSAMRDIETQYKNRLGQRNFSKPGQQIFIPTTGGIADSSSSALMSGIANGIFGGLQAGIGAQLQYGKESHWLNKFVSGKE